MHRPGETNGKSMQVAPTKWEGGIRRSGGPGRGGGGAATVSGQKSEKRENTQEKGGNLVPAVPHLPPTPPPYTLFIVHKWAGINSFNLELNVLTLVCLPPHLNIDFHGFFFYFRLLHCTRCSHWPQPSPAPVKEDAGGERGLMVSDVLRYFSRLTLSRCVFDFRQLH